MVKNEDGTLARGSKLATIRTLLDSAGLLTHVALSAIQGHAIALCRPLLEQAPVLRAGALLLADRGCSDGTTLSVLQRKRRVEVLMPRKANMLATQEAIQWAEMADQWGRPILPGPSRPLPWGAAWSLCGQSATCR